MKRSASVSEDFLEAMSFPNNSNAGGRQPAINLPGIIVIVVAIQVIVHLFRTYWLQGRDAVEFLITFAFIPARYETSMSAFIPGGTLEAVWSFLTYAFLHGDFSHLLVNMLFMAVFGSAVAWRFGVVRFLLFSAVCTIAGAAAHLMAHFGALVPMIGASAAVSGQIAAAIRFAFAPDTQSEFMRVDFRSPVHRPALPLLACLQHRGIVVFIVIWMVTNYFWGTGVLAPTGEEARIAWEAHVGGFVAGLILFHLFDPIPTAGASST